VAFYAYAIRDIQTGEEISMDYGPNFFDECPCSICNPPQPHSPNSSQKMVPIRSEEEVELEKREKRKEKRRRQKINRKKGALP
jgi:SET domain-containing protein